MVDQQVETEAWRGKVGKMSREEMEAFLAEGVVGRLGVLDDEGAPYVVPVWYQFADEGFYVVARERSVWAEYMQHDPRVFLAVDVQEGLRKVLVKGEAELLETPNIGGKWVEIAREMSFRYLGPHGPDYLVPTLSEPRWLFFIRPVSISTWQGVDWAKRYKGSAWGTARSG